jgi:hypothetical protein
MKDHSARRYPCGPWHGRGLTHLAYLVNIGPVLLSSPVFVPPSLAVNDRHNLSVTLVDFYRRHPA